MEEKEISYSEEEEQKSLVLSLDDEAKEDKAQSKLEEEVAGGGKMGSRDGSEGGKMGSRDGSEGGMMRSRDDSEGGTMGSKDDSEGGTVGSRNDSKGGTIRSRDDSEGGTIGSRDDFEGVGDQSDSNMESLKHSLGDIINTQPLQFMDRICMSAFHRNLKEVSDTAREKQLVVQNTRDKLSTCQLRMEMLAQQLEHVDMEIEKEEAAGNVAALSRLQAMRRRLCTELEKEKDFELQIYLTLKENLLEMWQMETEQGKYEILHEQLQKSEDELEMQYQERAKVRIWKEKIAALQAGENQRSREKKEEEALRECEEKHKKMLEDAKRNHKKAVFFLRKSMARIHERNAKEEVKTREHMERRIQAVLSLKTSIASNREKLRTLQVRKKAMAFEAKEQEMRMREAILAEGGNVAKEILLQKRLLEHEKEKQAYREQQKSRKIEIVSQILREKASLQKQKRSQSCTKAVKRGRKLQDSVLWRERTWQYIEECCKASAGAASQWWCPQPAWSSAGERTASEEEISEETPHDVLGETGEDEEERDKILVEPEFPGLGSQECDLHKISKEEMHPKPLEKFQAGISPKQIVSSQECKGRTFYSKPSCIHFQDFDVGKIYKKKIVLINASYRVNFCRLVGVSEWLEDFITVHFNPPGKVSSGMSCEFMVMFKPMINETLEGEVMFAAQTGSFSVPLKCTVKRCILALDKELIDFGSHVVGETISRTINLTNSGALGTRFKVQMAAGDSSTRRATAEPSLERMQVIQHCSTCGPEKVSSDPVTSAAEEKEPICPEVGEERPRSTAQEELQGAEMSQSNGSPEQLGQDVLNSRSALDTANAHSLVELSAEETPVEFMLGKVTEGEIGPFSSVKLQIQFVPAVPGDARTEFVITFDNPDCKPLFFSAVGVSLDLPVWVPNPNVDLKICMYDQLYQDCVVIQSRAKATLCLKFEVCKELSKHMELLPKTGYIQAESAFSLRLKFLPRPSLPEDAGNYFNEETGILEVPVKILVVDKAKPVHFTVHAIVTTSDLEISPARINFGYCTIYEAVWATVKLTNKSILPQEFGFVGIPETERSLTLPEAGSGVLLWPEAGEAHTVCIQVSNPNCLSGIIPKPCLGIFCLTFVEIQPNDGFGILLPLESLTLDVIFKANKAREYSFELTCKSETNRQFKLSCRAVGVHPPLELSHSLVQFAATALNEVSTATLYVMNSHVSINPFTHPVPRIGKGEVAPVGPTSFEFHVPKVCPVTVTPSVGTVWPGKKSLIQVSFNPMLSDQQIREEAVRRLCRAAAAEAEMQERKEDEKRERKKSSVSMTRQQAARQLLKNGGTKHPPSLHSSERPKYEELKPDSDAYVAAQAFLMRNFRGRFEKYIIPCFVASGCVDEKTGSGNLSYSPYNTLYLELHCPAVAPAVVVTSDHGKSTVSFGGVAVGRRIMKPVAIQNITPEKLELSFSVLNPNGPFLLVRPVKVLEPGENKPLIISFCPSEDKWFFDTLEIQMAKPSLTLSITGHGVTPTTVCSVGELDMGYVITGEQGTSTFKIQNTCSVPLPYSLQLDSLSSTEDEDQQKIPSLVTSPLQRTGFVGTQNYDGLSAFSISPAEGELVAGNSQDFTVTFSPDHESLFYSDRLKAVLFGKKTAHVIHLKGAARDHPMFVEGGIPLEVPVESLAVPAPALLQEALAGEPKSAKSILLVLECLEGESSAPARAELRVGSIHTPFVSKKVKSLEFSFESPQVLQQKGFTLEATKGKVERGRVKRIGVSWVPPAGCRAGDPLLVTALLTLKYDVKETYQIFLMARVVSASAPTEEPS